jgi:hypothetical protein
VCSSQRFCQIGIPLSLRRRGQYEGRSQFSRYRRMSAEEENVVL